MKFRTAVTAAAVSAITAATVALAGCSTAPVSSPASQPLTYAPAAYGVPGHCYYVDDPAEAAALEAAGLCPRSWVPTLMPVAWHEEYWDYYDSPAYYGTYVPARVRVVYVQRERSFGRTYRAAIVTRSRTATYRSSSGQVVKGTTVTGKTRFGSGKSFGTAGQRYGGGSLRPGGAPAPHRSTARRSTSSHRSH